MDRHKEIHVVDRGGNDIAPGMPMTGDCSRQVDPVQQAATEQGADGLASFGRTISVISDCESPTERGVNKR